MWFDLQTDFYKPLWIRLSIVVVCFGWAGFEFFTGGGLWAALFAFLGAVALQQFFLSGWPASENAITQDKTNDIADRENGLTANGKSQGKSSEDDDAKA